MAVATSTALLATAGAGLAGAAMDARSRRKSLESMEDQKRRSQEFIQKQMKQARGDLFQLFPSAQESRRKGIQAGLDTYRQALPAQMNAFQQGNMGAQQALSQGLPQIQNAILGNEVDMSQIQPQQIDQPNFQVPEQAPQFEGIGELVNQPQGQGLQPGMSPDQMPPEVRQYLMNIGMGR